MYSIVSAEKGSYDSNIKMSVLAKAKNKENAIDILIELLKDEMLMRMTDKDFIPYSSFLEDNEALSKAIKEDIEKKVDAKESKLYYENGESYIELNYNRIKNLTGYTIPCSSLNEYMGKTVELIAGQ